VGYYVSEQELFPSDLEEHLSLYLPEYMLPKYYVQMDSFPLTSNGKIDRRALPDPELTTSDDYVGPTNEIEKQLIDIWKDLLSMDKTIISTTRTFFEYGGDSLNLLVLSNLIFKKFNVQIPIIEMFDKSSIKKQAEIIDAMDKIKNYKGDDMDLNEVSI
ncbi:phosphopantetheine-binding protein, partial [Maribacter sp. 2307UL18-2]|uniref:phosphopantetheine-binding protein n=1 Tax=Maribacter sp. 2307UL18-2 TaxID=3386274 RepID=UPI0039BCCA8F